MRLIVSATKVDLCAVEVANQRLAPIGHRLKDCTRSPCNSTDVESDRASFSQDELAGK